MLEIKRQQEEIESLCYIFRHRTRAQIKGENFIKFEELPSAKIDGYRIFHQIKCRSREKAIEIKQERERERADETNFSLIIRKT